MKSKESSEMKLGSYLPFYEMADAKESQTPKPKSVLVFKVCHFASTGVGILSH